ncbi:MAG: A/G-specific adenine glycosylase [Candidatus Marinimicrobia bacterium]|nr:A/G-specific adenine glycosylase [Candidatus Neomarinimicrobiota bacterium]
MYQRDLPWRNTQDPYKIWLSEIMLQQTQVDTVIPYYSKWLKKYPCLTDVAKANEEDLLKMWEGLGYYNRCRNFKKAGEIVLTDYAGEIPTDYDGFIQIPGVGEYIASAVLSMSHDKPHPALDGNIMRVMSRFLKKKTVSRYNKKVIHNHIFNWMEFGSPGDINQALMDIGSQICKPNQAHCYKCPLEKSCLAAQTKSPESYPATKFHKPIPNYDVVTGVIWEHDKFLILKRDEKNHLGGLWEFPGGKIQNGENHRKALAREIKEECGIDVNVQSKIGSIKHVYSHFSIHMTSFHCVFKKNTILKTTQPNRWIKPDQIKDLPFPKANHKLFAILNKQGWHV